MRLLLRHIGEGKFVAATALDKNLAVTKIGEMASAFVEWKERRSVRQNRWLHGLAAAAWANDPQDRFESPEHLRAWAFCEMGFCEVIEHKINGPVTPAMIQVLENFVCSIVEKIHAKGKYAFVEQLPNGLRVKIPHSWAFDELGKQKAGEVADRFADICCTVICPGATVEGLFEAAEREAA